MIRPGDKIIAEKRDERRHRIPRWLLLAVALTVLTCGLCCLVAPQAPNALYILNWPRSATGYEPGRRTTATLWTDKMHYKEDESIRIRFTVKNTSSQPVVLKREYGPAMDLAILFMGDAKPYRWSELYPDQIRALQRLELQPNEEYTIEWVFKDYHKRPTCAEVCGSIEVFGNWQWANGELGQLFTTLVYGS